MKILTNLFALKIYSQNISKVAINVSQGIDKTNLIDDFTNLNINKNSFQANIKIIKTQQDMQKNIIDLLA